MKRVEFSFRGGDYLVIKMEDGSIEVLDKEGTLTGSFLNSNYFIVDLFQDLDDKDMSPTQEDYKTLFNLLESL